MFIFINEMKTQSYINTIELAGIPLSVNVEYKEASQFFASFGLTDRKPLSTLSVSEKDWEDVRKQGFGRCGQIEASILTAMASDTLLSYDRVLIHSVAFLFRREAWLFTADPRVGKSTQIRFLMELYPGEFSVICGDRPVLQLEKDGRILVHPSPWNGKENWHGAPAAPLAGIFCLQRGERTAIQRLRTKDAVIPVFSALISTRETKEEIRKLSELETALLQTVPVYQYVNGGVPDSTRILYRFLTEGEISDDL